MSAHPASRLLVFTLSPITSYVDDGVYFRVYLIFSTQLLTSRNRTELIDPQEGLCAWIKRIMEIILIKIVHAYKY